jgi:hypothetical protein
MGLLRLVLDGVARVLWSLDLVDCASVAVFGLDVLTLLKDGDALVGYRPLIHMRSPLRILTSPISYQRADFPEYLWDAKASPVVVAPVCGIQKSVLLKDSRQSLRMSPSLHFLTSSSSLDVCPQTHFWSNTPELAEGGPSRSDAPKAAALGSSPQDEERAC